MKIAILGSGPSALFALAACGDLGITPEIIARNVELPEQAGAFYIHKVPYERATVNTHEITICKMGANDVYVEKQWGKKNDFMSSFGTLDGVIEGYKPRDVYENIYKKYLSGFRHCENITDEMIGEICKQYDMVFQTFPSERAIKKQPPRVNITVSVDNHAIYAPNIVIYNGLRKPSWVRRSFLFGTMYTEYPKGNTDYPKNIHRLEVFDMNPFTTEYSWYDGIPRNLYYVGRWAEWKRHMLAHEAYYRVKDILNDQ